MALIETRRDFVIFENYVHEFYNRFSFVFCYLTIHIKLLSYFFLFFKILICFGYFSDSVNISEDYEYSFFPLCVSAKMSGFGYLMDTILSCNNSKTKCVWFFGTPCNIPKKSFFSHIFTVLIEYCF